MKEKDTDIFEQTKKFNSGIRLYMFQTGSIKTKLKFIKMTISRQITKPIFILILFLCHIRHDCYIVNRKQPYLREPYGSIWTLKGNLQMIEYGAVCVLSLIHL